MAKTTFNVADPGELRELGMILTSVLADARYEKAMPRLYYTTVDGRIVDAGPSELSEHITTALQTFWVDPGKAKGRIA
jgi:hypothetical protein